jgi:hypothetical protein
MLARAALAVGSTSQSWVALTFVWAEEAPSLSSGCEIMTSAWSWRPWIFCPCACRDKDARHAPGAVSAINGIQQPDLDGAARLAPCARLAVVRLRRRSRG